MTLLNTNKGLRKPLLMLCLGFFSFSAYSQTAQFSLSKTKGCGNTEIEIVDKSTGSPAVWEWDFGNGVVKKETTSKSYKFVYPAGTHTITLKVSKDGNTSEYSQTMTIYPNPHPDFDVESFSGCINTEAVFTNKTQSDAEIVSYLWGFGDGGSSTLANPKHTYIGEGSFKVGLHVVDKNGCDSVMTKESAILVTKPLVVSFDASETESCAAPLTSKFTSSISNGSAVEYAWDFGDASSTDEENPTHTFANDGSYTVSLTAKTNSGCPTTKVATGLIQVNTFAATIAMPTDACVGQEVSVAGTATSAVDTWSWDFGNGDKASVAKTTIQYSTAGTYTVNLSVKSTIGCSAQVEQQVVVHEAPVIDFSADKTHGCEGDKLTVAFTANQTDMQEWSWDFGDGSPVNVSPSATNYHIYDGTGTYSVSLETVDKFGCKSQKVKSNYVAIGNPEASVFVASNDEDKFCVGSEATIANTSSSFSGLQNTVWNVLSATVDFTIVQQTDGQIVITSTNSGEVVVNLTVTDNEGCSSSVEDTVKFGEKLPTPTITAPLEICYKDMADLDGSETGKTNSAWTWEFGDGTDSTFTTAGISYKYQKPGDYTMKLFVKHYECPSDVVTKDISIKPPKADFVFSPEALCVFPGEITFDASSSEGVLEYEWKFGDGATSTEMNPTHTYIKANSYTVTLITKNGSCTDEKTMSLNTSGMKMGFMQDTTFVCQENEITFTDTSEVKASFPAQYIWNFGDGVIDTVTTASVSHAYQAKGSYTVSLKIITNLGCEDSITGPETYTVYSLPQVKAISANVTEGCAPLSVNLKNTIAAEYSIAGYLWNFGDGLTSDENQPTHIFEQPKQYDVQLTVTDEHNCSSTLKQEKYITATFPTPNFTMPTVVCWYDSVAVVNTSVGEELSYVWEWGDKKNSTEVSPKHKYIVETDTIFNITLHATDKNSCTNSITKALQVAKPIAEFTTPETIYQCPPAEVSFTNKSKGSKLTYSWNFGEPIATPIILQDAFWQYYSAGKYDVTLQVIDEWGCKDTMQKANYITVNGPKGTLTISSDKGCTYDKIVFTAENTEGVAQYSWIYGDGEFATNGNSSSIYSYSQGGLYMPSVTLIDDNGCEVSLLGNALTVYSVEPGFSGNLLSCMVQNMELKDLSVAYPSAIESWKWVFTKDGVSDTVVAQNVDREFAYGVYDVSLITEVKGCIYRKDSLQSLKIYQTPEVDFSMSSNPAEMLEAVEFTNLSDTTEITEPIFWKWNIGSYSTKESNVSHYFSEDGDLEVSLLCYTHEECVDTATQTITVNRNIRIPNVFTPNGDGINDIFMEGYPDVALVIINRWGQELYRGLGGWDGTCNGQEMSAGTYFYMITLPNGEKLEGPLMLIRN